VIEAAFGLGLHVFCEKPVSLDAATSSRCCELARGAGVAYHVGLHRRFDPDWRELAAQAVSGSLGGLSLLRLTQRIPDEPVTSAILARNGTLFADTMIHDFDAAVWLLGEDPVELTTIRGLTRALPGGPAEHTDTAVVVMRFASDAIAVLDNTFVAAYGYENTAELVGRRATVRLGWEPSADRLVRLEAGAARRSVPSDHVADHPAAYLAELEQFAAALRGDCPSLSHVLDELIAFELAEIAAESCRQHATVAVGDRLARLRRRHATDEQPQEVSR
jgi:myo-inositol 2-dehydrogenase/D-chiro-inositol 1-dehydrogenase